jgi:hypothetical protein
MLPVLHLVICVLKAMQTKTAEEIEKYSKRTVRVTKQHNDECKRLLVLLGVPIIEVRPWWQSCVLDDTATICVCHQLSGCKHCGIFSSGDASMTKHSE